MGYGCRIGDVANDRKKEQVVEDYKQHVSFDWKSETEDRAYCFGSEWPEILWLDVPRAVGPFQDRVELCYISFIEARVIPVGEILLGVLAFFIKVGCPSSLRQVSLDGSPLQTLKLHIKSVLTWSFYSVKMIYAVAATQANTHSGNMSPTSPRSRIVYSGYSLPQALQNNAQSNFSSGHDSLKLLSSILKKRLTQINGHALRKIAKEYEIFLE
ncbi:hypothetical protein CFC21_047201 [Triticum aestivum]|uniref:Uncharacterized protein n=2 Tax=Triticum aestivum TaxID=4565 RepID=A0A3B6GQX1_WHEAT|nr:hypothetical protein CFC21_047201 [Triticum aestivum]